MPDELRVWTRGHPKWVKIVWSRPVTRLALGLVMNAVAIWIVLAAFAIPPVSANHRAIGGLWAAIAIIPAFTLVVVESLRDLLRGENRALWVLRRPSRVGTRRRRALMSTYAAAVLAAYGVLLAEGRIGILGAVLVLAIPTLLWFAAIRDT